MMADNEVGELWREAVNQSLSAGGPFKTQGKIEMELICKLVEERRKYYHITEPQARTWDNATTWALRDFGIDSATWDPIKGSGTET